MLSEQSTFQSLGKVTSPPKQLGADETMNWRRLDLNLLVVFDAVMQERNATRAAERLNMSQSAVSHALGRLRAMLGDELFVRTPEGMTPTPQAERLAPSVRQALADLRAAIEGN